MSKADVRHYYLYDSDPIMLVHLHDISSPIPLSRPMFNSEWMMSCKNILYVDSYCKSSYLCSRAFLRKSNLGMRPHISGFYVQRRCRHCCFVRLSTLSPHCFLKIPLLVSILTFRRLSHLKMYEISSSSGESKVEQCAIERKSSLIYRWNQVSWEAAILLDKTLQFRHTGTTASIILQTQ